MRNLSGLSDSSFGEFIIHFTFPPLFFPHRAYRENQSDPSSQTPSIVPSAPVPGPIGVLLAVTGGLIYVYEYLSLARVPFLLAFHALQRFFLNLARTP